MASRAFEGDRPDPPWTPLQLRAVAHKKRCGGGGAGLGGDTNG